MGVCQEGGTQHQVATTSRLLLRGVFWCKAFNCAMFLLLVRSARKELKMDLRRQALSDCDRLWSLFTSNLSESDHGVDDNEQDRQRDRGREKCVAIKGVVRDLLFGPAPLSCFALVAPLWWKALPAFPSNFQWGVNVKSDGWGKFGVCVEGEIFDLRGENIANWGNLAV